VASQVSAHECWLKTTEYLLGVMKNENEPELGQQRTDRHLVLCAKTGFCHLLETLIDERLGGPQDRFSEGFDGPDSWEQGAYIKASNTGLDHFGTALGLGDNGMTLAVGAGTESSAAVGVQGDQYDESISFAALCANKSETAAAS